MLSRGETRTVFQLEGSGMTRSVQELQPSTLDHLAALVALYRPGPMAHIPSYIARREGREAAIPPDPSLADVLEESYGIIVYQDQVLQVVRKLAGLQPGPGRRPAPRDGQERQGGHGPGRAALHQPRSVEHGYAPRNRRARLGAAPAVRRLRVQQSAQPIATRWSRIQTAFFKANYPAEWFAAVLSTIAGRHRESGRRGRRVPPRGGGDACRPTSTRRRSSFGSKTGGIRFGLAAVKNVGEGAVEQIVREREANGPYVTLEEFCRRQDLHTVNKRVIESLAKCGAMDALGQREALLDSKRLDSAIAAAQIDQKAASTGQVSLFDMFDAGETLAPQRRSRRRQRSMGPPAAVEGARDLGEGSPRASSSATTRSWRRRAWLAGQLTHDTSQLTAELSGERVKIGGLVTGVRRILTKTKSQMAVLALEDLHGTIEAVVFPRVYERLGRACCARTRS